MPVAVWLDGLDDGEVRREQAYRPSSSSSVRVSTSRSLEPDILGPVNRRLRERIGKRPVFQRVLCAVRDQRAHHGHEDGPIRALADRSQVQPGVDHPVGILLDEGQRERHQSAPHAAVDPSHDAEIVQANAASIITKTIVAGVWIAYMEEAIAEDLHDVAVHELARSGRAHGRRQTVQVGPAAELLDHHRRCAQLVHHVGQHDVRRVSPGVGEKRRTELASRDRSIS